MSDDLSKLTPTDPSAVDPDWGKKRPDILQGVLAGQAPRRSGASRWIAGVAAAALVVVAIGGIAQQVRNEPYATPAPPTPTTVGPQLLAAHSLLLGEGDKMGVCLGIVAESLPPQCRAIPVTGITWEDVPWADHASGVSFGDAVIVGTFDGKTFQAATVHQSNDPDAPQPPDRDMTDALPRLCETPTQGSGSTSTDALVAMAETLPGYQALWVSQDQVTFNVAVNQDVAGARAAVAEAFGGKFCVGTVDGPTDEALSAAQQSLEPLTLDPLMQVPPADLNDGASIWGTSYTMTGDGNRLQVNVVEESPELLDEVEAAVGPEVWLYTDVFPFFYPVQQGPPSPTTPHDRVSEVPGTATSATFSHEQRGWAEQSVATVLKSAGLPEEPAVTARMALVTYGQYIAVWDIDIPTPPRPPADDADVLVVALMASLDGSWMRGGPRQRTTPGATANPSPREPIGTVSVLDPNTGESLSHATILGGEPPADRILELPGHVEDVALPEGFR